MIYLFIFVVLFLFSFSKGKKSLYKIGISTILLITCLRARSIGIDTAGGYYSYFNLIEAGEFLSYVEIGWVVINKIALSLGLGYSGVLAISGLLTFLPVSYVLKKTCENPCYGLAAYYGMYFVLFSYNLMRQMIAISFALLAMHFYINKKYKYALLWFILGFLFHNTIVVILPTILFLRLGMQYSWVVFMLFVSFLCGLLLPDDFFFIISGRYATNLLNTGGYAGFRNSQLKPALFSLLLNIFFLFLIRFNFRKNRKDAYFLISLLSIIVTNLTMRMGQGTRIVLYFSQAQAIFFTKNLRNIKSYENRSILNLLYITYLP